MCFVYDVNIKSSSSVLSVRSLNELLNLDEIGKFLATEIHFRRIVAQNRRVECQAKLLIDLSEGE